MLGRNCKSATDLGIPENVYAGLIKVLGMMERGELRHVDITAREEVYHHIKSELSSFNMGVWCEAYENCGTVCCIGGAVEMLCDGVFDHDSQDLYQLFHPGVPIYEDIPFDQAAGATANYLTTGKPEWESVLD